MIKENFLNENNQYRIKFFTVQQYIYNNPYNSVNGINKYVLNVQVLCTIYTHFIRIITINYIHNPK